MRIVNLFHSAVLALPNNFSGKIDFVVRRANAWTDLHDQVSRRRTKACVHLFDRSGDNTKSGPLFSRMNQAKTRFYWIDDINGGAIRYVNAEANFALVGKESVRAVEATILGKRKVDNRELIAVDLFSGSKTEIAETDFSPSFGVSCVEA